MSNWRYNPLTGTYNAVSISNEEHTIAFDTEANAYGIRLKEAPQKSNPSTVSIVENASGGSTFTEITARTAPSSGQFWVDYDADTFTGTGFIEFNSADNGTSVLVDYYGLGAVVKYGSVPQFDTTNAFTGTNTWSGSSAFSGSASFSGAVSFTGTTTYGNANIAIFSDVKNASQGGSLTGGSVWTNIRTINTTVLNNISGCSLASNQITLPSGTYYIRASAPAYLVDEHQIKLYNQSDSTDVLLGTIGFSDNTSGAVQDRSFIEGYFSIASSKNFEIRHACNVTNATNGAGAYSLFGDATYLLAFIQKVA